MLQFVHVTISRDDLYVRTEEGVEDLGGSPAYVIGGMLRVALRTNRKS